MAKEFNPAPKAVPAVSNVFYICAICDALTYIMGGQN